ncbi:MAG TPA: LysM peptidoglycan-binding domain-containing protein [Gammaproteobacteria bacterium]|nr:LysM peptidoglycan-binding domain-containing protein [Gammaproteobacteria bacterium]
MIPHRAGGLTQQESYLQFAGRPRRTAAPSQSAPQAARCGIRPRAAPAAPRKLAWAVAQVLLGGLSLAALATLAGCETFALQSPPPPNPAAAVTAEAQDTSTVSAESQRGSTPPLASDFASPTDTVPASATTAATAGLGVSPASLGQPGIELEPPPPAKPDDLLGRLRKSFSLPVSHTADFDSELQWFAAHPEYLQRVFDRASPYLYYIANQLYARGMPAELALLPVVESAYDPFAYSRGRAAGLWQIIPGTARRLGLRQDWWFDGRRDVVDSTRAALDYLQLLHERFDGDWLLAIAGYNSGGGTVARAIERARAAGRDTDFWSIRRYLPAETRTYVPRLLALSRLVAHPEKFGIDLPTLPDTPQLAIVDTGGQIDMARAADLAGLDIDDLYKLNPGVNRWATDPNGSHRLVVPIADADAFRTALASLPADERVEWTRYKIEPGDTLIVLARKFTTTPDVLREANRLHGNAIRAGDYLMIPHAAAALASYSQTVAARLTRKQNLDRDGQRHVHVVQSGETLWSISQQYGVRVASLAKWNGMAPGDTLSVGRKLVVWTSGQDNADAPELTAVSARVDGTADDRIRRVNYVVRPGDSLSSIARRFRVSVGDLLKWNDDLSAGHYLHPGDQLVMLVNVTEQST